MPQRRRPEQCRPHPFWGLVACRRRDRNAAVLMLVKGATEADFDAQLRSWGSDPFYQAQYVALLAESPARLSTMAERNEPADVIAKEERFAVLLESILEDT